MPFPHERRRQAERCTFHAREADVPRGQTVNMADSDSDVEMLALYLYVKRRKSRKRRHDFWVHDIYKSRSQYGEYHHLVRELFSYEDKFFIYFRMVPATFHEIHVLIKDDIQKEDTFWRMAIGTEERLAICLR